MKKKFQGSIFLLLATIIWGSAFVAQSVGMDHVGPFTFQAVRCAMAATGLFVLIFCFDFLRGKGKQFFRRWQDRQLWKAGIFCGIPLFLAANLQQLGLVETDAGKSAFLTAMYIVIVPVIGFFRRQKTSRWIPVSVVLAVIGLYCLSCVGTTQISSGDWCLICCAFMFAVQITFVDIYAGSVDALRLNCIQSLVCAVLSAVVMLLTEKPTLQGIWACRLPLSYAGFLSMGIAYSLQILGQKELPPAPASLIMSMESVFAVLFGWLLLHETMTAYEAIGCVLIFVAVVLSQLPDKKKAS